MNRYEAIYRIFPEHLQEVIRKNGIRLEDYQEICIRSGRCIVLRRNRSFWYLTEQGCRSSGDAAPVCVNAQTLYQMISNAGHYSIYACQEQIRQGFLTMEGGHRIGLAGEVVCEEGNVRGIQYFGTMMIRISHEKTGCATELVPCFFQDGVFQNVCIISPPGHGKTTILRDIIRILSDEYPELGNISVIDERMELSGACRGELQHNLGLHTDVMCGGRKKAVLELMIRSLHPWLVAMDEISRQQENRFLKEAADYGVHLIATLHGSYREKERLISEWGDVFERFVFLRMESEVISCQIIRPDAAPPWKEIAIRMKEPGQGVKK